MRQAWFAVGLLAAAYALRKYFQNNEDAIMAKKISSTGKNWAHPLQSSQKIVVTAPFGQDRGNDQKHKGIDFLGDPAANLHAFGDGEVVAVEYEEGGAGHYIVIKHPNNLPGSDVLHTVYMHMRQKSPLSVGHIVAAGDVIGQQGNTGHVKGRGSPQGHLPGEHLHFEIRTQRFGHQIDPVAVFKELGLELQK